MTVDEILRAAMQLSQDDRTRLAGRLLDSVDAEVSEQEAQRLWAVEIERRAAEALAGESEHRDWREALDEIEQRIRR